MSWTIYNRECAEASRKLLEMRLIRAALKWADADALSAHVPSETLTEAREEMEMAAHRLRHLFGLGESDEVKSIETEE